MSRLDTLIERFRNKTISDEEHAELLSLLSREEHARTARKFFREIMDSQSGTEPIFSARESQQLYTSIQQTIQSKEETQPVRMFPIWKWAGVAAAACVLFVTSYWLMQPREPKAITTVAETKQVLPDLQPGNKNKAILVLADNKQIVLDSTNAGLLSLQGNSRVRKEENGQIIYESGDLSGKPVAHVYNELYIPNGGEYSLVLADGSKVWLNSASRIKFPVTFTGNTREVEINGEAYFEIAKDKTKPFKVHFNSSTVEVLGTHFNINSYDDENRQAVTLLEGSVKVANGESVYARTSEDKTVILKPGEQATLFRKSQTAHPISVQPVDVEQAVAWKNGYFMFVDEDIKSIMRKLARWYDFTPVYQGNVDEEQFGGMISRFRNISDVLMMFESTGTIHFKIIPGDNSGKGRKIIITK
ncbi:MULTISPECIES: FecR family protein [Niastella]|nr:FecR family protein [Niastella soli]